MIKRNWGIRNANYIPIENEEFKNIERKMFFDPDYRSMLEYKFAKGNIDELTETEIEFMEKVYEIDKRIKYSRIFYDYLQIYTNLDIDNKVLEWSTKKSTLNHYLALAQYNTTVLTNDQNKYLYDDNTANYLYGTINTKGINLKQDANIPNINLTNFDAIISEGEFYNLQIILYHCHNKGINPYLGFCGDNDKEETRKLIEYYNKAISLFNEIYGNLYYLDNKKFMGTTCYLVKRKNERRK